MRERKETRYDLSIGKREGNDSVMEFFKRIKKERMTLGGKRGKTFMKFIWGKRGERVSEGAKTEREKK